MKLWMMRSDGQPSASVTFAAIAFAATTLWFVLSIFGHIGPVTIKNFDSAAAMAYLTPILALYFGRRWTDAQSSAPAPTRTTADVVAAQPPPPPAVTVPMPTVTPTQVGGTVGQTNIGSNSPPSGVVSSGTSSHIGD